MNEMKFLLSKYLEYYTYFNRMQKVNIFPEYHKNKIIITCSSFANKGFIFAFVNAR